MSGPFRFSAGFVTLAALVMVGAFAHNVQAQGSCSLLPGRPEEASEAASGANKICSARYWIRGTSDRAGRPVRMPGIQFFVTETPNVEEATKISGRPAPANYRPVTHGDGGYEKLEDPNVSDDAALRGGGGLGSITGEGMPSYNAYFRCGRYFVSVQAEPSKGIEARRLISEMVGTMQSRSLCGAAPATTAAPAAPPRPPTPLPPTQDSRRVFSVAGDCVRDRDTLFCAAQAANPPGGVPMGQVRYLWTLDGAAQGARNESLSIAALAPGRHVVTVRAFTPDTVYTDTFAIQVP